MSVDRAPSHAPRDESAHLAPLLASRLRGAREDLVRHWLERITARVAVRPNAVFPTEELLNHVPLLIDGIADALEQPASLPDEDTPLTAKAMELGALRHSQGFGAYEILKEYEILGGIVFTFLRRALGEPTVAPVATPQAITEAWERVARVVELIRQATMAHFLRLAAQQVREREERLRRFNRMVSHELKNRVGAISGAAALLAEPWTEGTKRDRFVRMVSENAAGLQNVLDNLEALSRLQGEARQQRNVLLPQAAAEVARQLREAADARNVDVTISSSMPAVEVDAAVVELCLTNYLSNAIKYADPAKPERWARIDAELCYTASPSESTGVDVPSMRSARGELVIRVRDNGLGVPPAKREQLFQQFYRAHRETVTDVAGTGLGLSIVRETVESLGGRAWVEFPDEGGTVFAVAFPSRREEDAAAAGTHRVSL